MATNTYDIGDMVKLQSTFTVSDVATDPTTITFTLREPNNTVTTYVYGTDSQLVKSGTGIYYVNWTVRMSGKHRWRMVGTGACVAAAEGTIDARESLV